MEKARGRVAECEKTATEMSTCKEDSGKEVWKHKHLQDPQDQTKCLTVNNCHPNSLRTGQKRHVISPNAVNLKIQDDLWSPNTINMQNTTSRHLTLKHQTPKIKRKSSGPFHSKNDDSNDCSLLWRKKKNQDQNSVRHHLESTERETKILSTWDSRTRKKYL